MRPPHMHGALCPLLFALPFAAAANDEGYLGYILNPKGDPGSAAYKTANTNTGPSYILPEDPDVYLNATVDVESIRVDVANLVAKVNVDAKVLDLLHFSAGVDASIDRVGLQIDDVYARAELEARLGNVVRMVNDALSSIDLNPLVAAVGQNAENLAGSATNVLKDTTEGLLGGDGKPAGSGPQKGRDGPAHEYNPPQAAGHGKAPPPAAGPEKSPQQGAGGAGQQSPPPPETGRRNPSSYPPHGSARALHPIEARDYNILWLRTDPATGRAEYDRLAPNGDVVKVSCDARGDTISSSALGPWSQYLSDTGVRKSVRNERGEVELVFKYTNTLRGLDRVCWLHTSKDGTVVGTEVEPFDWSQIKDGT